MSKEDIESYCNMQFYKDTASTDFYAHLSLKELELKCELNKDTIFRCRTIGILQSVNGRFYLTELSTPVDISGTMTRVSVTYLKFPLPSTIIPYPVQVFGTVCWSNKPVIIAKFIQTLNVAMALRMRDAVKSITETHLATVAEDSDIVT
ncbi:uncharacterized protein ACR2FA_006571 [Aphomia sociella]